MGPEEDSDLTAFPDSAPPHEGSSPSFSRLVCPGTRGGAGSPGGVQQNAPETGTDACLKGRDFVLGLFSPLFAWGVILCCLLEDHSDKKGVYPVTQSGCRSHCTRLRQGFLMVARKPGVRVSFGWAGSSAQSLGVGRWVQGWGGWAQPQAQVCFWRAGPEVGALGLSGQVHVHSAYSSALQAQPTQLGGAQPLPWQPVPKRE